MSEVSDRAANVCTFPRHKKGASQAKRESVERYIDLYERLASSKGEHEDKLGTSPNLRSIFEEEPSTFSGKRRHARRLRVPVTDKQAKPLGAFECPPPLLCRLATANRNSLKLLPNYEASHAGGCVDIPTNVREQSPPRTQSLAPVNLPPDNSTANVHLLVPPPHPPPTPQTGRNVDALEHVHQNLPPPLPAHVLSNIRNQKETKDYASVRISAASTEIQRMEKASMRGLEKSATLPLRLRTSDALVGGHHRVKELAKVFQNMPAMGVSEPGLVSNENRHPLSAKGDATRHPVVKNEFVPKMSRDPISRAKSGRVFAHAQRSRVSLRERSAPRVSSSHDTLTPPVHVRTFVSEDKNTSTHGITHSAPVAENGCADPKHVPRVARDVEDTAGLETKVGGQQLSNFDVQIERVGRFGDAPQAIQGYTDTSAKHKNDVKIAPKSAPTTNAKAKVAHASLSAREVASKSSSAVRKIQRAQRLAQSNDLARYQALATVSDAEGVNEIVSKMRLQTFFEKPHRSSTRQLPSHSKAEISRASAHIHIDQRHRPVVARGHSSPVLDIPASESLCRSAPKPNSYPVLLPDYITESEASCPSMPSRMLPERSRSYAINAYSRKDSESVDQTSDATADHVRAPIGFKRAAYSHQTREKRSTRVQKPLGGSLIPGSHVTYPLSASGHSIRAAHAKHSAHTTGGASGKDNLINQCVPMLMRPPSQSKGHLKARWIEVTNHHLRVFSKNDKDRLLPQEVIDFDFISSVRPIIRLKKSTTKSAKKSHRRSGSTATMSKKTDAKLYVGFNLKVDSPWSSQQEFQFRAHKGNTCKALVDTLCQRVRATRAEEANCENSGVVSNRIYTFKGKV